MKLLPMPGSTRQKPPRPIEEIRFYLEHGMPEQASAAFEKLQTVTSDEAILSAIEAEIQAAAQPASAAKKPRGRIKLQSEAAANSPLTSLRPKSPSKKFQPP